MLLPRVCSFAEWRLAGLGLAQAARKYCTTNAGKTGPVVCASRLPYHRISKEYIMDYFSSCNLKSDDVHLVRNAQGLFSGDCFLELETEKDLTSAMMMKNQPYPKSDLYSQIRLSSQAELQFFIDREKRFQSGTDEKLARIAAHNLPYNVNEWEIAEWFRPLATCVDVDINLNSSNRPDGSATAYFENESEAQAAMSRHSNRLQNRPVNLKLLQNGQPMVRLGSFVLMQGVPFQIMNKEVEVFFDGCNLLTWRHILNRYGQTSGTILVECENSEAAAKALSKDNAYIGKSPVNLSTPTKFAGHQSKCAIRIRGLPFSATAKDVEDWLAPVTKCKDVSLIRNAVGRSAGIAIVELESEEDVLKALTKDNDYMGDRYLNIYRAYT